MAALWQNVRNNSIPPHRSAPWSCLPLFCYFCAFWHNLFFILVDPSLYIMMRLLVSCVYSVSFFLSFHIFALPPFCVLVQLPVLCSTSLFIYFFCSSFLFPHWGWASSRHFSIIVASYFLCLSKHSFFFLSLALYPALSLCISLSSWWGQPFCGDEADRGWLKCRLIW